MGTKIEILNTPDPGCDAFVRQIPGAKISHLSAWGDAVAQATGLKNFYLVAIDNDKIRGVLPLTQVRSRLFGNRMISQAFSTYGGPLADSPKTRGELFNYAVKLATTLNCESIEFRNVEPLPYDDLEVRTGKICMQLSLLSDPNEIWKALKSKTRNHIRKAEKSGITIHSGSLELLNEFYHVYTIRMQQLGTPPYSSKFMKTIMQTFPDNCRIFTVRLGNLTVGAGLTISYNGFVEIPWAATLVQYNKLCPNNLLYWHIIKHYCVSGAKCFDFGRCTENGPTYQFKKEWTTKPVGLNYQYWLGPNAVFSILSPYNPKYKRKVEIWKKLPLWVTRLVGPYISRNLS